jgi:hypothetical protein
VSQIWRPGDADQHTALTESTRISACVPPPTSKSTRLMVAAAALSSAMSRTAVSDCAVSDLLPHETRAVLAGMAAEPQAERRTATQQTVR